MSSELYHYGVKGMKWGIRRYQNEDGSLTEAGKKRASKEYDRAAKKTARDLNRTEGRRRLDAYNRAANYVNNGGINKFNAAQEKKYGKNYADRPEYERDYYKMFNKEFAKNYNKALNEFYENNKNYQRSKAIVEKYGMLKWNEAAVKNEAAVSEVRESARKGQ